MDGQRVELLRQKDGIVVAQTVERKRLTMYGRTAEAAHVKRRSRWIEHFQKKSHRKHAVFGGFGLYARFKKSQAKSCVLLAGQKFRQSQGRADSATEGRVKRNSARTIGK